jgi:peptidoglycan/xylan/chitin deacetylase (PgdA/CDA1 family)
MKCIPCILSLLILIFLWTPATGDHLSNEKGICKNIEIPILLYHRFGSAVTDSMTVTTSVFESQLTYLRDNGYTVIPLRQLVHYVERKVPPSSAKLVAITVDDGHRSVYTDMLPLIKKYKIPVTLFIYPSAISNAPYAMTWDQLREMKKTGLVDFQSHTYWHPNFKEEKKILKPSEYDMFVDMQLKKSKHRIEDELGTQADFLAWPFGWYDSELIQRAIMMGYIAAFTMEKRHVRFTDNIMALPRYMMTDTTRGKSFERIMLGDSSCAP